MSFADNLQYLRKREKITQEELADQLDVSRQSVSKWETGEAYPETDKLVALCDKFGVTMDELVRGDVSAKKEEEAKPATAQKEDSGEEKQGGKSKSALARISTVISSVTMLVCTIIYILIGSLLNLWHPGWIIFLGGIVVCIWSGVFADNSPKAAGRSLKNKFGSAICGSSMIIATIVFLLLGFLKGLWHPGWVSFLVGVVVCSVTGPTMCKSADDKKSNGAGK